MRDIQTCRINPTTTASLPHQPGCIISIVSLLSNKTNISVSSWQYGHYFICFLFPRLLYLHTPSVLELIYINVTKPVEVTQITRSAIDKKRKSVFVLVHPRQLFSHYVWYLLFDVCLYQCIDCVFLAGSSLIVSIKQFR